MIGRKAAMTLAEGAPDFKVDASIVFNNHRAKTAVFFEHPSTIWGKRRAPCPEGKAPSTSGNIKAVTASFPIAWTSVNQWSPAIEKDT